MYPGFAAVEEESEQLKSSISSKNKNLENAQSKAAEEARGNSKQQKNAEKNLRKRQILLTKKEDLNKQIRELGILPEEAYTRHSQGIQVEKVECACLLDNVHGS